MPDLTIVSVQICAKIDGPKSFNINGYVQSGLFSERHYPQCTCKAYQFAKRTEFFGNRRYPLPCKHIKEIYETTCSWHGQYSPEHQDVEDVCPRCGGLAVWAQVGV